MRKLLIAAALLVALPIPALAATPSTSFAAGSVLVEQYGSGGTPLVLIPGLTDSGKVWDSAVERYSPTHRVYVLTLPGFGGRPPVGAPMLDAVDADIAAFLAKAGRPVLIGHSMGAFLAIRLAEEHSDLIRGVVAADGLPVFAGLDAVPPEQRAAIGARAAAPLMNLTADQLAAASRSTVLPYMTKPANLDAAAAAAQGADPKATGTYESELIAADIRPQLGRVHVPLLELAPFDASIDPQNPYKPFATAADKLSYYQTLLAGDPAAVVATIDDSRHFMMLDQPAAFFAAVDTFLGKLHGK